jgi:hypothetical protein
MAMGRRDTERQQDLFVPTAQLPRSIGHVFYSKLNELLAEAGFDAWVENLCQQYYAKGKGRPGIPPGVYFRMLLVLNQAYPCGQKLGDSIKKLENLRCFPGLSGV